MEFWLDLPAREDMLGPITSFYIKCQQHLFFLDFNTAQKMSVFRVFLIRIFPHFSRISAEVFSQNAGKCGPEILQILTLFTKCKMSFGEHVNYIISSCKIKRILIRKLQTFYQENHQLLYESCTIPCRNYGDIIFDQAFKNLSKKDQKPFNLILCWQ